MKPKQENQRMVEQTAPELEQEIRCRAYELYEERGRTGGHDMQDWLEAESADNEQQNESGCCVTTKPRSKSEGGRIQGLPLSTFEHGSLGSSKTPAFTRAGALGTEAGYDPKVHKSENARHAEPGLSIFPEQESSASKRISMCLNR